MPAVWKAVIGAGARGQAVAGAVVSAGGMHSGCRGRNGAPEARFGVQQGVSGDHLLAWRGLAGPLRAPVPRGTGKMSARVALAAAASGAVEPVRGAVRARDRERCAAWKLTHPDAAGELAGPEVQCWRHAQRVPGVGTERLRDDSGFSRGGIRRPPARVAGPCRAAESASSAPQRQDVGRGGAAAATSGAVEPVRGAVRARDRERCAA